MTPPYTRLANAEHKMIHLYPEARTVKALWTPSSSGNDIHVEVWHDGGHAVIIDPGYVGA